MTLSQLHGSGRQKSAGQSMVEFALLLPILMFTLIGIFEYGLMAFGIASARFAVSEGARVASQVGRSTNSPVAADVAGTYLSGWPRAAGVVADCNADCEALVAMHKTSLGTTDLAQVDEVDVWQLYQDPSTGVFYGGTTTTKNGTQQAWTTNPKNASFPSNGPINRYTWSGTKFSVTGDTAYPPAGGTTGCPPSTGRNDCAGSSDYMGVTIQYHTNYKSGLFQRLGTPQLYATFYVRIEPQRF